MMSETQARIILDRLRAAEEKAEAAERVAANAIACETVERNKRLKAEQDLSMARVQLQISQASADKWRQLAQENIAARESLVAQLANTFPLGAGPVSLSRRPFVAWKRIDGVVTVAEHVGLVLPAPVGGAQ